MSEASGLLLVGAVAAVGVLHTIVPDHWVPITLLARQRSWSTVETARVAFRAGLGHVLSTLAIALVVWLAGVAVAARFGHWVDTLASLVLIGFGGWIAISGLRDLHRHAGHGHHHSHGHGHDPSHSQAQSQDAIHGPELQRIETDHGEVELSIYEAGVLPHFRLTGHLGDSIMLETRRPDGARQLFQFADRGAYWESTEEIPEPHQFSVSVAIGHHGHTHTYSLQFTEHEHHHEDHSHQLQGKTKSRTALVLILGSSPMVEGIPAFFAASKYGVGLIIMMSVVFGATTIATYMLLCVYSAAGLRRIRLRAYERYGEVLSGGCIALVGLAFWTWPII